MKLHDYQQYAVNYILEHPIAALFLDMGLGKTVITLTALKSLLTDSFEVARVLVVAPLRVARSTWPDEIKKWEHLSMLTYAVAVGTESERLAAVRKQSQITIINRENVPWLVKSCPWVYDMVVIDELSSFKNFKAVRSKALNRVRPRLDRIVGLTGTPAPNGLEDLWAEFRLLDMGQRLGRFITPFRQLYMNPDKRNANIVFSYKPKPRAEEIVMSKVADITMSMSAVDHLDMPALRMLEAKVKNIDYEIYDKLKTKFCLKDANSGTELVTASTAGVLAGMLAQLANGAIYTDKESNEFLTFHDAKLDALEDLIEQANGQPVLVAYWFKHDLIRIKERFSVRELNTDDDIKSWNRGEIPIAVIHPASAGHGLNLQTGGNILIWFGVTWSLELYQQTNARLYRQGQQAKSVVIYHIIAEGTIDEEILRALERKEITQDFLIKAVKAEVKKA